MATVTIKEPAARRGGAGTEGRPGGTAVPGPAARATEYVRLGAPRVDGGRVTVDLRVSPGVAEYLAADTFWVDYGPEADLTTVPDAILAIPAVGNLITLAWTLGVDLSVAALDRRYAAGLAVIARTMQGIYPKLKTERSALHVDRIDAVAAVDRGRVGLLYSGGIDSNASLLAHHARVTDLFTVWGADVPLADEDLWRGLTGLIAASPPVAGKAVHLVRSNLREVLNNRALTDRFGPFLATGSWWGGIQHGLGLLSVTAPIAFRDGIAVVIEASSYTETDAAGGPPAFSPAVDEQIAWAGTTVVHDGYEQTRQDKIRDHVAPYLATGQRLPLAACYKPGRGGAGMNCGSCEKCLRTQVGLLLAGVDPDACGFRLADGALDAVVDGFRHHRYPFDPVQTGMWLDIQRGIPDDPARIHDIRGSRRFFAWLRTFDLEAYGARAFLANQPFLKSRLIRVGRPVLRALPDRLQARLRRLL